MTVGKKSKDYVEKVYMVVTYPSPVIIIGKKERTFLFWIEWVTETGYADTLVLFSDH